MVPAWDPRDLLEGGGSFSIINGFKVVRDFSVCGKKKKKCPRNNVQLPYTQGVCLRGEHLCEVPVHPHQQHKFACGAALGKGTARGND